jgi:cyanate permease
MKSDFRWTIPIGLELGLVVALFLFADAYSWSRSAGTWTLIAILALAIFVNDKIWRHEERIARNQGKPWGPRGRVK